MNDLATRQASPALDAIEGRFDPWLLGVVDRAGRRWAW